MEEKRRLRRRYLLARVNVRAQTGSDWTEAVLMNINRGGIGLYAVAPVRKKSKVVVRITYLDNGKEKTSEEIPGVVRWSQKIGNHYSAGIMFEAKINKKNYPILSKCLEYARCNK